MNYADREFIANAMLERSLRGHHIKCYPSKYSFKRKMKILLIADYGEKCMKCGGVEKLEIDHIKPISKYPELELDEDNVQLLCRSCNASKNNRHETDFRSYNFNKNEFFKDIMRGLNEEHTH